MAERKFFRARNIILIIISIILLAASVAGITIFLKDKGEAEAAEQDLIDKLPVAGNNEENNENDGEKQEEEITPGTQGANGNSVASGTTGGSSQSGALTEEEILAGITETIVEQERKVYEDLKLSWTTISIPTVKASMGIYKPELQMEKTATGLVKVDNPDETIEINSENVPMVRPGDLVIYTIKVLNTGNYQATNITITESLDVIFDEKEIKTGEPLVKLETLESGKVATLKVAYVVTEEDIAEEKNIKNTAYVVDGNIEEQDDDYIIPVNPDIEDIKGTKTWDDADNQDGKRPENITINLLADGEKVESKNVSEADNWKWTFSNLPKYAEDGRVIEYTISEEAVVDYTTTINGYDITNIHIPETVTVSGSKTWEDNNDQDGIRPDSIIINLLADGEKVDSATVSEDNEGKWKWEFKDFPKYEAGREIVYTIAEDTVTGYSTQVNGYNVTNTHTPETISVSGHKTWEDNSDQDGIRPDSITINLLADGQKVDSKTVTKLDRWEWNFTGLPKYEAGREIVYTIAEDTVTGYSTQVNGYNVTNTHTPETITVSGSKTWEDNNDQDGIRPDSITITLYANNEFKARETVTEADSWAWSFTGLPRYEAGREITYTIAEDAVNKYSTEVDGYNVTNTYTPETITISGSKTWNDNENQDGIRPDSITINLLADGTEVESKTVTETDNWSWTFTGKAKYSAGTEIVYTIEEETVTGYSPDVNGYNVTNTHTPETITVSGSKTWNDNNNQAGIRPTSITINLLANGTKVDSKVVTAGDNWSWSFTGKAKYSAGREIVYTIEEETVEGYTTEVNGYDITNTLETITVSVHKGWQVPYITTHPAVTVQLYQNDDEYDAPVTLNVEKAWAHEWTVPKYSFNQAGELIENEYTIREMSIVGTEQDLSQYNITYSNKDNNINEKTITNTAKGIVETISYTQGVDRYERPVDVVLVLDTSGSMAYANTNNTTRAEDMVTAVNETIATIMEHNAASRVAVVSYSDNAQTLLELGRYEAEEDEEYLSYNKRNVSISTNVKELEGNQISVDVEGATYIQSGIAKGANILTSENNDPIYEENGTEGYHIPILILLSDGAPTRYTTNYDEVGVATGGDGSTATNNTAYYTIKTAVAYKVKIAQKYNNEAHMYTIGYGVDSLLLRTVLEPSASNIEECKESDWFSYTRALYNNLANEGNVNYADGSYAGKMDSDELSTLLNHFIHSSITSTTHRIFSKAEIDAGKVYLENINKNKSFSLHYGDISYVTLQEAEQAHVVKEDSQGVYVDLSVIGTTKQIHVSYHQQ